MRKLLLSFIFFFVISTLFAQCPQLIWSDEFDGEVVDTDKWEFQIGDGCNINLCDWGNNELQYYQAANATVSDGTLKITARREQLGGKSYTSARMRTRNKADFTYGRMEARIKLPFGQGLWPAFWMLSTNEPYGGWPQSGEIDIMEIIGSEADVLHGTIHYGNPWPNNSSKGESYQLNEGIFNDDFHEFAIEWEPNEIRWYVDGYQYSRKTSGNVSPFRWPFDHNFHFLLNVAVGGNWPGFPNSSTPFPQVMEVDYVRVYDMGRPSIAGKRQVDNQEKNVVYSVLNYPEDANFNWTVPESANIVSGQGAQTIVVDWDRTGGDVVVDITSSCAPEQLSLNVAVAPAFGLDFSFENFDDPSLLNFHSSTGTLTEDFANPNPQGVNASALVGRYARNGAEQYDILVYRMSAVPKVADYLTADRKFFIDVYTDAPAGTEILLQLEDHRRASGGNYPTGRHSRFQTRTSVQNQWERLEFSFLDRPDNFVANSSVNQLIFLFASNSLTSYTFHWDNFNSYVPQTTNPTPTSSLLSDPKPPLVFYPNPADKQLRVDWEEGAEIKNIRIIDLRGRKLQLFPLRQKARSIDLDIQNLSPGLYFLQTEDQNGGRYVYKFVKKN